MAGVIDETAALSLVRVRSTGMAAASGAAATGMAAVLGGDPADVLAAIERAGLTAANVNGAGQIVAAGTAEQLSALAAQPPAKTRVVPLQVAGAFHTEHMASATEALASAVAEVSAAAPRIRLLSNADGQPVADGQQALDRLVSQVTNPVRWDLCMQTMLDLGVSALVELPPRARW